MSSYYRASLPFGRNSNYRGNSLPRQSNDNHSDKDEYGPQTARWRLFALTTLQGAVVAKKILQCRLLDLGYGRFILAQTPAMPKLRAEDANKTTMVLFAKQDGYVLSFARYSSNSFLCAVLVVIDTTAMSVIVVKLKQRIYFLPLAKSTPNTASFSFAAEGTTRSEGGRFVVS
jgi:hypothetical protein